MKQIEEKKTNGWAVIWFVAFIIAVIVAICLKVFGVSTSEYESMKKQVVETTDKSQKDDNTISQNKTKLKEKEDKINTLFEKVDKLEKENKEFKEKDTLKCGQVPKVVKPTPQPKKVVVVKKQPPKVVPPRVVRQTITPSAIVERSQPVVTCKENCIPEERPKDIKFTARNDGRCFIQTTYGYKFELRSEKSTKRIMVALVDPETNERLQGKRVTYVGDETSVITNKGPDCIADTKKLEKPHNWNTVRGFYNLPSDCDLKK